MNKLTSLLVVVSFVGPVLAQNVELPKKREPASPRALAPPKIEGLKRPIGFTERDLIQATIQEMPGGTVVVEDEAFSVRPTQSVRFNLVRILDPSYTSVSGVPLAPWMDGPFTISGGNTIAQVFPIGWGYH